MEAPLCKNTYPLQKPCSHEALYPAEEYEKKKQDKLEDERLEKEKLQDEAWIDRPNPANANGRTFVFADRRGTLILILAVLDY